MTKHGAAHLAASQLTNTHVAAVASEYVSWIDSKTSEAAAIDALLGAADHSKSARQVLARADILYGQMDDFPEDAPLSRAELNAAIGEQVADPESPAGVALSATIAEQVPSVVPEVTARQLLSAKTTHQAKNAPRAMVTFIDDDGGSEVYSILRPIFNAQGESFCACILGEKTSTGDPSVMTPANLLTLQGEGHEILGHGWVDGVRLGTTTDLDVWHEEMGRTKAYLESLGLDVNSFVYQGGSHSDGVVNTVSAYYDSAWTVTAGLNKRGRLPLDQYRGFRYDLDNGTLATLKGYVDTAVAEGGWVVFTSHAWYAQWATQAKQDDLNALIDYIQSLSVPIVTVAEGLEYQGNILDYGKMTGLGDYIKIEKSGRVVNKHNRFFSEPANTVLPTTPPSFFYDNAVTITHHNGSTTATGFPKSNTGTLITIRGLSNHTEQTWIPYVAGAKRLLRYRRTNSSESAWNAWTEPSLAVTTSSIPSLAVGASAEVTVDISSLGLTRLDGVTLNYRTSGAPPAGLMWSWYMLGTSDTAAVSTLTIRVFNAGSATIGAQPLYFAVVPIPA